MVYGHAEEPSRRRLRSVLDALFGEAWELERERRRRRRLLALLLCCMIAVAVGAALTLLPGGGRYAGTLARSGQVSVVVNRLPVSTDFTGLSLVHGRLILSAYGDSPLTATHGGTCRTAAVDPRTLRLSLIARGACDSPSLFGLHVMEVDHYDRDGAVQVRIATVDPSARIGYSLGPVLFSHEECSDCGEVSIHGPRSLWVYAPYSSVDTRDAKGELFRVSERTGKVLQRWAMPSLTRPLLATDEDGLWITSSIDGGGPGVLYHVKPGMRAPGQALRYDSNGGQGLPARFLIASRHTVWLESFLPARGSLARLWRLDGARVVERGRTVAGGEECADSGEGPSTVLGNASTGFYCVAIGKWVDGQGASTQDVFRVLPSIRAEQRVATVTPPDGTVDIPAAAVLGNSYYFYDPSTRTQGQTDEFYGSTKQPTPTYKHAGLIVKVTAP